MVGVLGKRVVGSKGFVVGIFTTATCYLYHSYIGMS